MLYRLINKTPNGIDVLLGILAKHIEFEGLTSMEANAETIISVSCFSTLFIFAFRIAKNLWNNYYKCMRNFRV